MNSANDPGVYLIDYPIWVPSKQGVSVSGTLPVQAADGRFVLLMFSMKQKAKAFLDASGISNDYVARPIDDPLALYGFIVLMEKNGAAHVSLDPIPGNSEITVRPLAALREHIERAIR